jgi:hypothetical protein
VIYYNQKERKRYKIKREDVKMTRTKWQDVLQHARYFAQCDYLEGIKPESWKEKNAMRELEDSLRMNNTIWDKYKGTDEEYDVMKFFIEQYDKELERLWNEEV